MDAYILIGLLGSLASIMSLAIAAPNAKSRIFHAIYGFVLTVVLGSAFTINQKWENELQAATAREAALQAEIKSIKSIQREAHNIIDSTGYLTTTAVGENRGFILAAFSFLEKHRDRFPESYEIAKQLITNGIRVTEAAGSTGSEGYYDERKRMFDGASTMRALLKGIAGEKET